VASGNGAISVFAEPPGGWQNQTQVAEPSNPDFLCCAEALSRGTLVAGAPCATVNGNQFQGAVDVCTDGPNGGRPARGRRGLQADPAAPGPRPA
jgi:hypothetical protein